VDELVDRHEFHGADAKASEVVQGRRMGESEIAAAERFGNTWQAGREAFDVELVDLSLMQRPPWMAVAPPVETFVDDDGPWNVRSAVDLAAFVFVTGSVGGDVEGKDRRAPVDLAFDGAGVGVEEKLVGVASQATRRIPGAVDAEAIALSRLDPGDIAVPAERPALGQVDARFDAGPIEQTQLDPVGDF
jgi:hypothetical protein